MRMNKNYLYAFVIYVMISIIQIIGGLSTIDLEVSFCKEVGLTLLLAWALQKDTPLQVELTVKK